MTEWEQGSSGLGSGCKETPLVTMEGDRLRRQTGGWVRVQGERTGSGAGAGTGPRGGRRRGQAESGVRGTGLESDRRGGVGGLGASREGRGRGRGSGSGPKEPRSE